MKLYTENSLKGGLMFSLSLAGNGGESLDELAAEFYRYHRHSIRARLSELVLAGEIFSPKRGHYVHGQFAYGPPERPRSVRHC